MTDKSDIQDPLKSLSTICDPDVRQKNILGTLQDYHSILTTIDLNGNVPVDVRQLFETAKNLSLYSWFVYRFHQVSELVAFSALEMALRMRYIEENPSDPDKKQSSPTLYKLMQHAKDNKWITNDGFPSLYNHAKYSAQNKKFIEIIETHDFYAEQDVEVDEPTEEEISEALSNIDMVAAITQNTHKLRNDLAHGSSTLHPNSISTLRTVSETINQIYP